MTDDTDASRPTGNLTRRRCPKPWGKKWGLDAVERTRIYESTGCSLGLRQRPNWGEDWWLTGSGPLDMLEEAARQAQDTQITHTHTHTHTHTFP